MRMIKTENENKMNNDEKTLLKPVNKTCIKQRSWGMLLSQMKSDKWRCYIIV